MIARSSLVLLIHCSLEEEASALAPPLATVYLEATQHSVLRPAVQQPLALLLETPSGSRPHQQPLYLDLPHLRSQLPVSFAMTSLRQ